MRIHDFGPWLPALTAAAGCGLCALGAYASESEHRPIESVLVQGERRQQIQLELENEQALTPGGVTLVDGAELYQRNVASLADMLRYVPGVWAASSAGGDAMFFSSRGSNLDATHYDMNGIKLLQDGLPVTTADGNNHNRMIDPLSAHYATVARGANALTYGASTLGGAIDFISPTARDNAPLEVFLNGGSHGQRQGRVSTGMVAGDFDALLTLEAKRWDGYRDHSEQQRDGLYANAGWQFNDALRTRLYLTYIDNEEQLAGPLSRAQLRADRDQAEPAAVSGHYQVNVDTWRVASKTTWDIGERSDLSVGFSYEEQTLYHPIVDKVMVDIGGVPTEVFSLLINTDQRNVGTAVRYNLRLDDHDLLVGLDYGETTVEGGNYRNDGGRRNGLTTAIDNQADGLELFLVDRWQFAPGWTLVYGTQAVVASRAVRNTDVTSRALRNPEGDYHSINPRLGVIYRFAPDMTLFANVSRLYEAPTNYQLEDDVRAGNETLDAMNGTVLEVGSRGEQALGAAGRWHWDVALYHARLNDEILSVDDPGAPGTSLSTNVDDTIHAGIEALIGASFALDAHAAHRLEPRVSLTVNDFRFDDDAAYRNNALPAAPGYAIQGEILYRHASGWFAGPTFEVVDERYADFANSYQIDSYALLGLRAGLTRDTWQIYAEARNLTGRNHISTHRVLDVAAPDAAILRPGEPRSVYVGVKLRL